MSKTWTVQKHGKICPGTMWWSYLHQHTGAINGIMAVNGKEVCQSTPVIGTVPGTGPDSVGNEKGYCVKFNRCIDAKRFNNSVRLNVGDRVTITGNYDVDPKSTRNLPIAGGKHGGIMALFFFGMDCDEGTSKDM